MSEKSDAREEVQELSSDGVRSALNWRIGGSESNAGLGLVTCRYCGMPPLVENGKAWCIKAPGDVMTIKDWQNWNAPPTMQTKQ